MDSWQLAAGTVLGRDHRDRGINNQDGLFVLCDDDLLIAIVTDGCSDTPHSEVGAKIGARVVAHTLAHEWRRQQPHTLAQTIELISGADRENGLAGRVLDALLPPLSWSASAADHALARDLLLRDYFLFTVVGALVTKDFGIFFSIGDGIICINDDLLDIGPFPGNAPPFIAYAGMTPGTVTINEQLWNKFCIHRALPACEIRSFLIGTDGLRAFRDIERCHVPGRSEVVGPISQFWKEDGYFTNADKVRRRLAIINADAVTANWSEQMLHRYRGLLTDDTTLVVGRRTPCQRSM